MIATPQTRAKDRTFRNVPLDFVHQWARMSVDRFGPWHTIGLDMWPTSFNIASTDATRRFDADYERYVAECVSSGKCTRKRTKSLVYSRMTSSGDPAATCSYLTFQVLQEDAAAWTDRVVGIIQEPANLVPHPGASVSPRGAIKPERRSGGKGHLGFADQSADRR